MSLISFESYVHYEGNAPHIISIRPILNSERNAGDLNVEAEAEEVGRLIRTKVQQEVNSYNGWHHNTSNARVKGFLVGMNVQTGDATADDGSTRAETNDMKLRNVNGDMILSIINKIQHSQTNVTFYDIEWRYTIVPQSIIAGGAPRIRIPTWAPQIKFRATWEAHSDSEGHINCAAYAINYLMWSNQKRYDKFPQRADQDARALQIELGWGEDTTLAELEDFVVKYPQYRITAFLPNATENAATFKGAEFEYDENDHRFLIYLVYDAVQNHYGATKSPGKIIEKLKNNRWSWCHYCCIPILRDRNDHLECEGSSFRPTKKAAIACKHCGVFGKHTCPKITCRFCTAVYERNTFDHRCILYKAPRKEEKNVFVDGKDIPADGKHPALFVYDLESRVEIKPSVNRVISEFQVNEDGTYKEIDVAVYDHILHEHKANLVVFQNVFSNEEPKVYFGEDCLDRFLMFMMQYNGGNNICVAHNASGYDTRLIFTAASKFASVKMHPIMRGAKFMQLKINQNLVFIDSLLHVKGSLRNLASDFVPNSFLRKGHFPHLFNSVENYSYVGKIPDKKYFDLSFVLKTAEDKVEFDNWYNSWSDRDDWSFMDELKSYCIDDVRILKEIVKGYHDVCMAHTNMTPWLNSTAPSFVHEVFLTHLSLQVIDFINL